MMDSISGLHAIIASIVFTAFTAFVTYHIGKRDANITRTQLIRTLSFCTDQCVDFWKTSEIGSYDESKMKWIEKQYKEIETLLYTYAYVLKFDFFRYSSEMVKIIGRGIAESSKMEDEEKAVFGDHIKGLQKEIIKTYQREYIKYKINAEIR